MPKRIFHKNGIGFRSTDWLRLIVPVVVLALFGLAAWKLGLFDANGAKQVESATGTAGTVWFQPVFVLVFAALAALAMPLAPLAYGAGAIFGIVRGSILSWIASMIGATAGYYLARGVLAGTARRLLGKRRDILHDLGGDNRALTVFRIQLMPIVPFGMFNYAAAVSRIPFGPFIAGTALGVIPKTVIGAFIGERLMTGVSHHDKTPAIIGGAIAIAVLCLSYLPALVKRLRR